MDSGIPDSFFDFSNRDLDKKKQCPSPDLADEVPNDEEHPSGKLSTKAECERFLIHALLVAGKNATFGNEKTDLFLAECGEGEMHEESPFEYVRRLVKEQRLYQRLLCTKTGNYQKMQHALEDIANSSIDVLTCTYEDLRKIHGIGPKTARYFLMYSRPDINNEVIVVLDRHTLHWLRDCGYKAPDATPQDEEEYMFWARAFAREARKAKMTVREADTFAWNKYSKNKDKGRERVRKATKHLEEEPHFTAKAEQAVKKIRKKRDKELDDSLGRLKSTLDSVSNDMFKLFTDDDGW